LSQENNLPRITVVTPSLNQGHYLRQCIESVLSQNYKNLEFIIIDGGSTDESLSVIKDFESHIDYWVSEPDDGQSDAINKGFRHASGELVAWLNADDYYLPGAFEKAVEAYRADRSAPFYFGDGLRVSGDGSVISNFFPEGTLIFDRQALVMGLNYILQPSTFINRQALEQVGYLDTTLHYGMDSDLWMRLSAIGMPQAVKAVLSATREYAETKTASGSFKRVEELRQISMRHTGLPVTPGVLCYMMDTLYRFAKENEGVFPPAYLNDIVLFWQKSAELLKQYNAGADGFPRDCGGKTTSMVPMQSAANHSSIMAAVKDKLAPRYHASLAQGIDFRKEGYPDFLYEVKGVSDYEAWGRWTDARINPSAEFYFHQPLPQKFTLVIEARDYFGLNESQPIKVALGESEKSFVLGKETQAYSIDFINSKDENVIIITPPHASEPTASDARRMGIGFISLKII